MNRSFYANNPWYLDWSSWFNLNHRRSDLFAAYGVTKYGEIASPGKNKSLKDVSIQWVEMKSASSLAPPTYNVQCVDIRQRQLGIEYPLSAG